MADPAPPPLRQHPERGSQDPAVLHAILDAALVCQVAFVDDGRPHLVPMLHWRRGDRLYLHAARHSRIAQVLGAGAEACVAVTHLDGLVLARSAYAHTMNYRSAVVYGRFESVEDPAEKQALLQALFDRQLPGRWAQCRPPSPGELAATAVLGIGLDRAVAKVRTGPPADLPADQDHPAWAGVLPCALTWDAPVAVEGQAAGLDLPAALLARLRG